ncbi:uncharacterized protein LOC126989091 isoform X21 [Eriocheir sinensis]|uniref:uncharacterized protein LOC126989091 isoform X21 n=1 Tax=Eriocheir sinensis TaxID=95602 RepID=UPI0021C76E41|nr:uncharacterized protein LOC126989091 isoform X21 [Eriocheir sinensis]
MRIAGVWDGWKVQHCLSRVQAAWRSRLITGIAGVWDGWKVQHCLSCSSRLALPSHHWDSRRVGWVEGPTLPLSCSSRLALPSHHWDSRRVGWVEGPTLPLSCSSRLALPSHHWDSRRVGWVEGPTLPLSCSSRLALPSHHWEGLLAMSVALRNTCCPLALKAGLQPEWPGAAEQTVTGVRTKA